MRHGAETKDERLLSFDRRRQILEAVNRKKSVTVDSLAEAFDVSRWKDLKPTGC